MLLPFVALALMSPAENWNPRGPKPKTMDEYVGDVWNLDGLAIAEPGYMDPLSGFPRIKGSYRVSWKRNGRRVEGTLGIDGTNVELRDNKDDCFPGESRDTGMEAGRETFERVITC